MSNTTDNLDLGILIFERFSFLLGASLRPCLPCRVRAFFDVARELNTSRTLNTHEGKNSRHVDHPFVHGFVQAPVTDAPWQPPDVKLERPTRMRQQLLVGFYFCTTNIRKQVQLTEHVAIYSNSSDKRTRPQSFAVWNLSQTRSEK